MKINEIYGECTNRGTPFVVLNRMKEIAKVRVNPVDIPQLVGAQHLERLKREYRNNEMLCYYDGAELHFVVWINPLAFIARKFLYKPYINLRYKRRTTTLGKIYTRIIPIIVGLVLAAVCYACGLIVYWAF